MEMEMEDYRPLNRNDLPRWFTLGIDSQTGFPCVRIDKDIVSNFATIRMDIVQYYREEFCLDEKDFPYQPKPDKTFGFGDGISLIENTETSVTYRFNLPKILEITSKPCQECRGRKKRYREDCFSCGNTGKERIVNHKKAKALSASASILMRALEYAQPLAKDRKPDGAKQLLTVRLIVQKGLHGGSLGGLFSPHFINTLKKQGENVVFQPAVEIMRKAYKHMWGDGLKIYDHELKAWQSLPGNLILDVPGNACDIHPSPHVHNIRENEGVEFSCHNVDTSLQQLTFVTGLAAMCDLVEQTNQ